jgi:hypothetical protein
MTTIIDGFDYEVIEKRDDMGKFLEDFGRPETIGWDFETTGLD